MTAMETFSQNAFSADACRRAILAIEQQTFDAAAVEPQATSERRDRFFALLDSLSGEIFHAVARASALNKRSLGLGTVPGFLSACDQVFRRGPGACDAAMLNQWLSARDLRHVFSATETTLDW